MNLFDKQEQQRDELRGNPGHKGRLTFDCFLTREREGKVICSIGHPLSMALASVLRSRTAKICKTCKDFES